MTQLAATFLNDDDRCCITARFSFLFCSFFLSFLLILLFRLFRSIFLLIISQRHSFLFVFDDPCLYDIEETCQKDQPVSYYYMEHTVSRGQLKRESLILLEFKVKLIHYKNV